MYWQSIDRMLSYLTLLHSGSSVSWTVVLGRARYDIDDDVMRRERRIFKKALKLHIHHIVQSPGTKGPTPIGGPVQVLLDLI